MRHCHISWVNKKDSLTPHLDGDLVLKIALYNFETFLLSLTVNYLLVCNLMSEQFCFC